MNELEITIIEMLEKGHACLARFDAETKASFLDLFEKVTAPPEPAIVDEIDRAAAESYEVPASI